MLIKNHIRWLLHLLPLPDRVGTSGISHIPTYDQSATAFAYSDRVGDAWEVKVSDVSTRCLLFERNLLHQDISISKIVIYFF